MDLLAPCRSCLQCLPFLNVSPPSPPRPAPADSSPKDHPPPPDAPDLPLSSAAPPPSDNDLASSRANDQRFALHASSYDDSSLPDPASAETKRKPDPEIPVSGSPSSDPSAASDHAGKASKHPAAAAASEPALEVPFNNDGSSPKPGVFRLPLRMTESPFSKVHDYLSANPKLPEVFKPKSEEAPTQHGHESNVVSPPHHHDHHGENHSSEGSANTEDGDVLETSISTPVFLGTEYDSGSKATAGNPPLVAAYHSEPVLAEVADDESDTSEEIGTTTSQSGRRRSRNPFKQHFKGLSKQIKQGGLHLKEEGGKQLQTMMANINKQAQEFEQSGRLFKSPLLKDN